MTPLRTGKGAGCRACDENAAAEQGHDRWAVARLQTGVVRVNPVQHHRGSVFFVAAVCVAELHDLPAHMRALHLAEMAEVAAAVFRCVTPRKMNYEALGNSVPHLHWWLTPRHDDDPRPGAPSGRTPASSPPSTVTVPGRPTRSATGSGTRWWPSSGAPPW
jgi:diadenosine tetraphosphate (Ap4A) HIT family hydrolase